MTKKIIDHETRTLDGNAAAAEALRQIEPEVFGFYPITPTSYIGEKFSKFVADGDVDTEYVCAESEHAALSICVGAAAAGARAVTATASQGLILMAEVLWNASGTRLPIVLVNGNRALSAPLSIHCGHDDLYAVRDSGWGQLVAKNAQEAYDFLVCSFRIAEAENVRTPLMMAMDCFHTTHTAMKISLEPDDEVQKFVGEIILKNPLLDIENPTAYGNFTKPDFYMEHKRAQLAGLENMRGQAEKVLREFAKKFGRGSGELVEKIGAENPEIAFVAIGSVCATLERAVEKLGNAAVVRPKMFRPFPSDELREKLKTAKKIIVLDRCSPCGAEWAPLGTEIRNLGLDAEIRNGIFGLGSRETHANDFVELAKNFENLPENKPHWINLREEK
ncbi:pyruvate ferredoxin oxidoreductase [bacterium]|jgi:pyruvate ferredoxin oxidoreductase alpha subunit|nr:pyruvate ferredoxin oxidoreductase [bacterium]MBT6832049.1 pyruvate ferredoxin oxidoreductase [bacterium]MBT6995830.1 pyruvate ferredoxin oxidoreductase [bacterium]MBT7772359.1 pyruvate ferredoxin oxidoreductase [bacterium]